MTVCYFGLLGFSGSALFPVLKYPKLQAQNNEPRTDNLSSTVLRATWAPPLVSIVIQNSTTQRLCSTFFFAITL